MTRVKGNALATRVTWARLHRGEDGVVALQDMVSPALADALAAGVVNARWYPFEWFIDLNVALDRAFGRGDLALVRELGRYGADANLTTVYRAFYRAGKVVWLMARAARLWSMYYDSGRLLMRRRPSTGDEVELEILEFATPHEVHCLSVYGWAERSAELSGGRSVALSELDCRARGGTRCRFRLRWQ